MRQIGGGPFQGYLDLTKKLIIILIIIILITTGSFGTMLKVPLTKFTMAIHWVPDLPDIKSSAGRFLMCLCYSRANKAQC